MAVIERRRLEGRSQGGYLYYLRSSCAAKHSAGMPCNWCCHIALRAVPLQQLTALPAYCLPATEWNISRAELANLVDCGLLTSAELSSCVVSSWDCVQVAFHGSQPVNCGGGILDCGVSPRYSSSLLQSPCVYEPL